MLKAARLYRIHGEPLHLSPEDWSALLSTRQKRPLGGSEARRNGWGPVQVGHDALAVAAGGEGSGAVAFTMVSTTRVLPAKVLQQHVAERCAKIEADEARMLRRQERQAIKEQVYEELLPRAFTQDDYLRAVYLPTERLIVVETPTRARAEMLLDLLRETLGSLKVTPYATSQLPVRVMTEWARGDQVTPARLTLGERGKLSAKGDSGAISVSDVDLTGPECEAAVNAGWMLVNAQVSVEDALTANLDESLVLSNIRYSDAVLEESAMSDAEEDEPLARYAADMILSIRSITDTVRTLTAAMGGQADHTQEVPQP